MHVKFQYNASLVAVCAALLSPATAFAQAQGANQAQAAERETDTGQIDEIIVTAQRRAENVQNVPISITAIGAADARTLQSTSDVGRLAPNIQVEQTAGFAFNRTGVRGVAQGDFNGGSTTSNMVYLDDIPMNAMIAQRALARSYEAHGA